MGDLTTLHAQAKRLILGLRQGLERLESAESTSGRTDDLTKMAQTLRSQFADLQKTSGQMDSIWRMQVVRENASKRDVWKRKVEQIAEEVDSLRLSLAKYGSREQRRQAEVQEREELFMRAELGRRAKQEMDEEAQVAGTVQRSKRALEEMYDTGANILASMASNRERLKRAQKKMLDVLNSVGLGESVLKLIEKRQRHDILITYGGMALVLLITVLLVWWAWF